MNRRGFLKACGWIAPAAVIAPALLKTPTKTLVAEIGHIEDVLFISTTHFPNGDTQILGGMQILQEAQDVKDREFNRALEDMRRNVVKTRLDNYYAMVNPATLSKLRM